MKKVLISGDRNWTDKETIKAWLGLLQDWGYDTLIEGEARGVDTIAADLAFLMGFTILNRNDKSRGFPAQWATFGKQAGPIRNSEMLTQNPELVVAFHSNLTNSKGTIDMMKKAEKAGVKVILVTGKDRSEEWRSSESLLSLW